MIFNEHWGLNGKHAFLSPSNYHWVNDDEEKLRNRYYNAQAVTRGTLLHAFASDAIKLNRKLPKNSDSVNSFVNDALGYSMESEQILYYSDNCFGTADAISFRKGKLRIHDLKTGVTPASMKQLLLYAAIFCLEYEQDPDKIEIELRIYQNNEIDAYIPEPGEVRDYMDIIIQADLIISAIEDVDE